MVTNRVLLFGGNGQLGRAIRALPLPPDWHLGVLTRAQCDFLQPGATGNAIRDFKPDLVINAAAIADIETCEQVPDQAREVNFHAVARIAGQCDTADAPLIHISTDYVFDGNANAPYGAEDAMNPVNIYGQTKMMGEEAARHGLSWHVVLRSSLIFSAHGKNVLTKTLRQIDTQDQVGAVSDQTACPTGAGDLANAIMTIADAILHGKGNGFGTFHFCNRPAVTRFEFLQAIMQAYAPYTDRRPELVAVKAAEMPNRAPRSAYSVLDCTKIGEIYKITPRDWREELAEAVKSYVEKRDAA